MTRHIGALLGDVIVGWRDADYTACAEALCAVLRRIEALETDHEQWGRYVHAQTRNGWSFDRIDLAWSQLRPAADGGARGAT